ncbi:WXG100 family type VII secretion target [Amycolatopsis sp. NPDC051903]|uniref:WXG100 family type VII secretion target n=1 Tax=Amycolatopsis sp. NPDC051903 TaxID=3363936 RepID=UPI00378FB9D7
MGDLPKTHEPGDTSSLGTAQQTSGTLKGIHEQLVQTITGTQASLQSFWMGQAADGASAGLSPLIQSSQVAAENLDRAQRSMEEQITAFAHVRDTAKDVGKDRPDDNTLEDWFSFGASDDEKAAAKFDADTKFNVDLYEPYFQSTQPRQSTLAADYPAAHDPNVSAGGITPDQVTPGTSGGTHSSGGISGHSSGHSGGYTPGPSTYSAPLGAAGYQAPPPPGHTPAVNAPAANDSTSAAFAGPTQTPGGPGTQPWQGPGGGVNGPGGGGSSFTPGFGPVGGFGPGGGSGFGPGSGRLGGGFGPGGSGSGGGFGPGGGGASSGGAAGRGAGAGSGAGAMGEGAGAARPGGMGAAGAKGQPGMGGMGAGGAKGGKGTEDEEHQRKILLSEEDPDSIFGGYDGNKPTPPVIGA